MQAADHAAGDEERERDQHAARSRRRRCRACRSRSRWRAACRCRTRRRRSASDGPIGAIAPPKPGHQRRRPARSTSAATAISSSAPSSPPASPRTRKRRHAAVKLNSALRNATPSAKPSSDQRGRTPAGRRAATSATSTAAASTAAIRNGQSSRGNAPRRGLRCQRCSWLYSSAACRAAHEPKPSAFFRSSHLVRAEATGRLRIGGPVDHRAVIEPHVLAGRASPTARTSRSPPSGRCCNR